MSRQMQRLSEKMFDYSETLDTVCRRRYKEKCMLIDGLDPYRIEKMKWSTKDSLWPCVTYIDIVNYLIYTKSAYTMDELRAYKSMEAYNQFISGWVRDISTYTHGDGQLLVCKAQVLHSQRLSEKPLTPWVIMQIDGKVLGAHCDCMAGLGETCTHVGAVLFKLEAAVRIRDSKTVTQDKAYWLLPNNMDKVTYSPVSDIDFTSAATKKCHLDNEIEILSCQPTALPSNGKAKKTVTPPTDEELSNFFKQLHIGNSRAAILSVQPEYSDDFIPSVVTEQFPQVLTELCDPSTYDMNFLELLTHCDSVSVTVTPSEIANVEKQTRDQSSTRLWFRFRAGRITASRMKSVCHTDVSKPSQSLIKAIAYPEQGKFTNKATEWGCFHEKIALAEYEQLMKDRH